MSHHNIYLFYKPSCPFCQKVLKYLQSHHLHIVLKNISEDSKALSELVVKGGKRQVPCLFYDGEYLYESDDIISWIDQHRSQLQE